MYPVIVLHCWKEKAKTGIRNTMRTSKNRKALRPTEGKRNPKIECKAKRTEGRKVMPKRLKVCGQRNSKKNGLKNRANEGHRPGQKTGPKIEE